jgi:hypothetical protein
MWKVTTMINAAFDGKKLFEWEGDAEAVERIDDAVVRIVKHSNVTPEILSQSIIVGIKRNGGFFSPNPDTERMMVVWRVLRSPTNHPDHPGRYRDYIEAWNFDFDFKFDPRDVRRFYIEVRGG